MSRKEMTEFQASVYLNRIKRHVEDGELDPPDSLIGYRNLLRLMHVQQSSMKIFASSLTKRIKNLEEEVKRNTISDLAEMLEEKKGEGYSV